MTAVMIDDAIFESAHEALVFAHHYSKQQYAETPMSKLIKRANGVLGSGRGLVGLDGAAQAGFVMAAVERLQPIQRACIAAKFAPRFESCKCCGGDRPSEAFSLAIETLAAWAIPAGVSNMRVRRALVSKWAGVRGIEFKELASEYGMNRKTVSEHFQAMKKRLDDADRQAQCAIDDALRSSGMVIDLAAA